MVYTDQVLEDEINVCGREFQGVEFQNGIIMYDGSGPVKMGRCGLAEATFRFEGIAAEVMKFAAAMDLNPRRFVEMADGTLQYKDTLCDSVPDFQVCGVEQK
jgi:hypothetical protein